MDARYIAVLEIGSSKVKGAVARQDNDGTTLVATHEVATLNSVRHGRVLNVQEVAARVEEVIRRLENSPAVSPRRITRMRIALGGRSVCSCHASADVRLPAEAQITDETITRLKRISVESLPADRDIIAVLPRVFTVDGAKVSNPVGTYGTNIHADMTVVLASHDNRTNLDRVRLAPEGADDNIGRIYIPRQLALARMALTPSEEQLGVVLVDMGSETTTISIHREGNLQALVTLPMGGRNITRDIAAGLSITEEQAEYLKINQAAAIPDQQLDSNSETREICSYTQARAGEIIANILHRIEQAGFKNADLPAGIVLTGRAALMRRMTELFETQTNMRIRIAPADNSVSPGDTGLSPVDSLDIMALVAWPDTRDDGLSDLSQLPANDNNDNGFDEPYDEAYNEFSRYNDKKAADNARWRSADDLNDDNLLKDDDQVEYERNERLQREQKKKKADSDRIYDDTLNDDTTDDAGEQPAKSRFEKLRAIITGIGNSFIGSKGPDEIED